MAHHNNTGKSGEALALAYLQQKGFSIIATNWRHSYYEIDIIASLNDVLHFVEVKTRRSEKYGLPEESVSKRKMERLIAAAEEYLYQNPHWKRVQHDVLSIMLQYNLPPDYFFIEDVSL